MAFADDLKSFLENRLLALDPSIDLSPQSPAQLTVIDPILARFAEDPFSTDIPTFIKDRLTQEFPELVTDGGGALGDVLAKPLQLMLEPFKRQIELLKIGQSVRNASIMSDDEADALGANFFEERNQGGFSGGSVRLYFSAPTSQRVTPEKRVFTSGGLAFFPTESFIISSAQMNFNRQGSLYFMDITVRAENPGEAYNVSRGDIIGIDGVAGVVKATNLSDFKDGIPRESNEEFFANFDSVLTERSLVTRRGILARTPTLFESVRALSVVGAGEPGMNRDILTGGGQGFLNLAGRCTLYGDWLIVSNISFRDDGPANSIGPQAGDLIRYHPNLDGGSVNDPTQVQEATVLEVLSEGDGVFLLRVDKVMTTLAQVERGAFALFKAGFITISGVPGGMTANINVPDNSVHLGGHTDVFVRPTSDSTLQGTLENVTDGEPVLALTDVQVNNPDTLNPDIDVFPGQNIITSKQMTAADARVALGDLFVIETGDNFAGTYRIIELNSPNVDSVRVDATFDSNTTSSQDLRARVVRHIRVDLVEPKIPKLPFETGSLSDLNTLVGSALFTLQDTDVQTFGGKIGDTIRILDGDDAGDFIITGFDISLGGKGPIMDRVATQTGIGLRYQVFTAFDGLELPLVRIKSIEVLDSTKQNTGIKVPYGDAVDIRPTCDLEGAGRGVQVLDKKIIVLPDLVDIWGSTSGPILTGDDPTTVQDGTDARYSQKLEVADGVIKTISAFTGNDITTIEINLPPFMWNGRRDKLLALPTRKDFDFEPTASGEHITSDVAEAKIGDTITLHDGPNKGSYIIKDLRVLDLWRVKDVGHAKVALVQVDPEFPVDTFRTAINLASWLGNANPSVVDADGLMGLFRWATDFDHPDGYYVADFLPELKAELESASVFFGSVDTLKDFFDPLIKTGYSVGPAAKGELRLYFEEPVSCEFNFKDDPTTFTGITDPSKVFRLDPTQEPAQIFPESVSPTPPTQWSRNGDVPVTFDDEFRLIGDSFILKGVRPGDLLEYRLPINDIETRPTMSSSYVAVTQIGSNIVRLIFPPKDQIADWSEVKSGQLLFIDSGPDLGAYVINSVEKQDWLVNPPVVKVRVDRVLTHTTDPFPDTASLDFGSKTFPFLSTNGNSFSSPIALAGKIIKIGISTDGSADTPVVFRTHTFGAGPFPTIQSVISDCQPDLEAGGLLTVVAAGNELVIRATLKGRLSGITPMFGTNISTGGLVGFPGVGTFIFGHQGASALYGSKKIYGSGLAGVEAGQYITLYAAGDDVSNSVNITGESPIQDADDAPYLGTFQVASVGTEATGPYQGESFAELSRSTQFPTADSNKDPAFVRWIVHEAPESPVSDTSGGGKNISDQYVRFRLYEETTRRLTVDSIIWDADPHPLDPTSIRQLQLSGNFVADTSGNHFAYKAPFRFIRPGVRRISSTAMSLNREGALYFVDLPVVGLGPGPEMNVEKEFSFLLTGHSLIQGYTLAVKNPIFTFSDKEQVDIILPNSVLPVGSTPDLSNEFNLAGQNLQIIYDNAPLVEDLQRFFNSPQDRILVANILARHYLPSYVYLDSFYTGGSDEPTVAKDLISYINSINPDRNMLEASKIVDLIKRKGATAVTLPITLVALTHGTDRRIRGQRSENFIGGTATPTFKGEFSQTYFISGPDTSKEPVRPDTEQVFLKRT
jgi:hypothetical protein